ncbi:LPD7 domain-containing protein [Fluviibacter phosphoraccumulans]|uniref:LPD7 domain-containing protein n=1 Tax=Fluviibacter phosphoraccumulans TaxID=1751046 RepID=UPI0010B6A5B7|nr:LPD7 domain-containing protein [Fluviibacter phosphoraccumulans]BCA64651.1 hypothetical protein SHINM1_002530 [Fluviibacter phosphoraccumulans]
MPDQDTPTRVNDNEIEASIWANRYDRSVLDPANSPELVRKRYLANAGQYFFRDRDNALAFEDKGARIATRTEDPVVAAPMVDVAVAKGWKELKVTGSESFRRSVWLEATKRGMAVRGYEPKPQDELQLQEMKAQSPRTVSVHQIGPDRARAFTEQTQDEALKIYPELQKAYAGRASIYQWIDANIPDPKKQVELRAAIDRGMAERLTKGEIPSVVVLPEAKALAPWQANVIHKQAIVMGAVAKARGQSPKSVRIVIAAAERFGRYLSEKGVWIPEPMLYDRYASPRIKPSLASEEPVKPGIRRQPKIQVRR